MKPGYSESLDCLQRPILHDVHGLLYRAVLKLDIEGSEFDVVPNLVKSGIEIGQLLIEVHWPLHRAEFSRVPGRKQTTALHTHFFGALESLGFAIAHVEFNIACGFTCVEFLWVNRRLFSPRRDSR